MTFLLQATYSSLNVTNTSELKIGCGRDGISDGCITLGDSGHFLNFFFFILRFNLFALIGVAVCDIELCVTYP